MKLALISPYPPSKGTLNEYAYHLVNHFKDKDELTELHIISDRLPSGEKFPDLDSKVKIHFHESWEFNSWTNALKIRKVLKKIKPDVAFFNIQFLSFGDGKIPATLGLLTPVLCKWAGVPSVVLLHNIMETVDLESAGITKNPILAWIFRLFGNIITRFVLAADLVTVTLPKYVDILEPKYKKKNIALVPHGSFELPPMPEFKRDVEDLRIMTFGKFGTYKKVEGMIEAVDAVRKRIGRDIEIVIAGTDNPNVKGYLNDVAKKYAHIPDIRFTGYVEEEDVPVLFGEATAVLFDYTSTTGSSGVLHQAGSYGKASIIPKIGDLKELVEEEGYMGEYFEPGDVKGMADAVEKLLTDPDHRNALEKRNYAAAASLPLSEITDWYIMHFRRVSI